MEKYIERMIEERDELSKKIKAGKKYATREYYLNNDGNPSVEMLQEQLRHMTSYIMMLNGRIYYEIAKCEGKLV